MSDNIYYLDFNDAEDLDDDDCREALDPQVLKQSVLNRLPQVLAHLYPNGKIHHKQFKVGNVDGKPGKSLTVELEGEKAGLWKDWATNECGDVFDLWATVEGLDCQNGFPDLLHRIARWLGHATPPLRPAEQKRRIYYDDLGKQTHKWDYINPNGQLIACVYRYDPPEGKVFRVWDVKAGQWKAPEPRPLYNQQNIHEKQDIVLVEGEKCADALIAQGIPATTAMNGANAPLEKTDWSPLIGKDVVIWPDNDEAGLTYAERVAEVLARVGTFSIRVMQIPTDKPPKWDAADAVRDGLDIPAFIAGTPKFIQPILSPIQMFTLDQMMKDTSPVPEDLIEPRILTPGGLVVLGGAPKVGKSDFILSWLTYMAAGEPFLNMRPTRRLRIFYLQAEVQYHYLRERIQHMQLPELLAWRAGENLLITPQSHLILNEEGMGHVKALLRQASEKEPIDVIAIDPLRNVYDAGDSTASENDNQAMLYFLRERIAHLRDTINPEAGVILVHHTKKIFKRQIMEDPFLSFSGASALRGYYTTGMLLYRADEHQNARTLTFELRNGAPLPDKLVDKKRGKWIELEQDSQRLANQEQGEKQDAERRRKQDVIVQTLYEEALAGRVYTAAQFAEKFEGQAGLGAERTIQQRISVLATKGYIKFFKDVDKYGKKSIERSKFGYLCVEHMRLSKQELVIDSATGEEHLVTMPVLPTHYKCPQTGASLPVENPQVWVYQEEKTSEKSE